MTEVVVGNAEQHGDSNATSQPVNTGAGQLLRQAREQHHMTVQALASALKVPVYKVQALEDDRWDILTDSVFARALALSICRLLRIPAEPVLAGMPKHEAAKLASNPEGINAPFKEKSLRSLMSASNDSNSGNASKVVAALLVAVAIGAGLYFLPQWQSAQEEGVPALAENGVEEPLFIPQLQTEPAVPAVEPEAKVDAATPATPAQPTVANDAPAVGAATQVVAPVAPVAQVAPAASAVMTPALEEVPPTAAPAAGGRSLRFTASGETWVQVRDAKQQVLMEKILKAGDVYEETLAAHPLQVVVGNADATKLEIDGAAWNLAGSAKNNVARFEVK